MSLHDPDPTTSIQKRVRSSKATPVTARIEACLSCRFRRVKCERDHGWTPGAPCKPCKHKSIACRLGSVEQQKLRQNIDLADLEVFKTVRVCLVDEFFANGEWPSESTLSTRKWLSLFGSVTSVDNTRFVHQYRYALHSAALLQMKMVAPATKALLAAVVAAGARVTSHPLIIGKAPSVAQSKAGSRYDSRVVAHREAICTALVNQAAQIACESGILRHVGIMQVSTLAIISVILPRHDPQRRLLTLIRGGNQRQLQEQKATVEEMATLRPGLTEQYELGTIGLGWAPFLLDSWHAHETRTPLIHPDETVTAFSEAVVARTGCRGPLDAGSRSVFDALRCSFELLLEPYRLLAKLSVSTRNSARPDFGNIPTIYAALDKAFLLRLRAATFIAHDAQAKFIHTNIAFATSFACRLALSVQASLRSTPGHEAWQAQSRMRSLRESRCVVEAFERTMKYQQVQTTAVMGLLMRYTWDGVVDCMLDAPVTLSPGELDMMTWTTAEKMAAIAK